MDSGPFSKARATAPARGGRTAGQRRNRRTVAAGFPRGRQQAGPPRPRHRRAVAAAPHRRRAGRTSPELLVLIGAGRVKLERRTGERALTSLGHRGPGQMSGRDGRGRRRAGHRVRDRGRRCRGALHPHRRAPRPPRRRRPAPRRPGRGHRPPAPGRRAAAHLGLLLHGVETRLGAFLIEAVERWGQPHAPPSEAARAAAQVITAPFTHAEIALLIGSTRETGHHRRPRQAQARGDHRLRSAPPSIILLDRALGSSWAPRRPRLDGCPGVRGLSPAERLPARRSGSSASAADSATARKTPDRVRRRPPAPSSSGDLGGLPPIVTAPKIARNRLSNGYGRGSTTSTPAPSSGSAETAITQPNT